MSPSSDRSPSAQESPSSRLAAPAAAGQGVGTIAVALGLLFVALVNVAVFSTELGNILVDAATILGTLIARLA